MPDNISLRISSDVYSGWEAIEVTRSLDRMCGNFQFVVADKPRTKASDPFPIRAGDFAEVLVGGELYLSGWVDARTVDFDKGVHTITIDGRDATGVLVDCSPVNMPVEFNEIYLIDLVRTIADKFGLEVAFEDSGPIEPWPFWKFSLQVGEKAYDSIERACRMQAFLLQTLPNGNLLVTRAGRRKAATRLVEGRNPGTPIKRGRSRIDRSGRFWRYVVRGQSDWTDQRYGKDADIFAQAFDRDIDPLRTLAIAPQGNLDPEKAKILANWHANVNAANGTQLSATVMGYREQGDQGEIWLPGVKLDADLPSLDSTGEFIIAATRLSYSKRDGAITELSLTRPDAFIPEPPKPEDTQDFGLELLDEIGGPVEGF